MLNRDYQIGAADRPAPNGACHHVTGAIEAVVRSYDFQSVEVIAGHEIGDSAHRVRTLDRTGAFLEHLDTSDGDGGEHAEIDEAAADQAGG